MKDRYNCNDVRIIKIVSLLEVILLVICFCLVGKPLFNRENFFVFIVTVFSIYLYIITLKSLRF